MNLEEIRKDRPYSLVQEKKKKSHKTQKTMRVLPAELKRQSRLDNTMQTRITRSSEGYSEIGTSKKRMVYKD